MFGITGTNYGHGCYFATNASYSHGYSKVQRAGTDQSRYIMIQARVITGRFCDGNSSLKTAPYLPSSYYLQYDSVVNNVARPTIFVVFNDASAYPEYVIEYIATK